MKSDDLAGLNSCDPTATDGSAMIGRAECSTRRLKESIAHQIRGQGGAEHAYGV